MSSTTGRKVIRKPSDPSIMWTAITLEPMWFGVAISLAIGMFGYKNMFLERACSVDLNRTEEECFGSKSDNKSMIESQAQKIVTSFLVGSSFVTGFITSILFLFLGPWSDNSGRRKPLIMMTLFGMICSSSFLIILQFFPKIPVVWVIYAEVLPLAIGGNYTVLLMTATSYIGDICFKTGRCTTTLVGRNAAALTGFMTFGCIIGPKIFESLGYFGIFGVSLVLEVFALVYVIIRVEDLNVSVKKVNILDISLPVQAVKCVFKKREGWKRKNVILMVLVPCFNSMMDSAETDLNYLYMRNKFSWTEIEFGYFLTMRMTVYTTGILIIIMILKKRLHWKDKTIGICSSVSQISGSLLFMLAPNQWAIFGSNILMILTRGAMVVERPILNKQIKANEQGKINCVTAVTEKFIVFIFTPIANFVYNQTLDIMPGLYMLIVIIAAFGQMISYILVTEEIMSSEESELNKEERT